MAHAGSSLGKFFGSLQSSQNRPSSSSVGNLFASVAAKRLKGFSESDEGSKPSQEPGKDLTMFLVKECKEKRELQQIHAGKSVKLKRRYNNNKRRMLASSRQSSRGAIQKSRPDEHRVRALVEQPSCTCSLGTCFSQFLPIIGNLIQLIAFWAEQDKLVRDEVLRLCLRSTTCALGLKVSIACFRVLFKLGKRGVAAADLRMRGQPRLKRSSIQETKARQYLVGVYCRLGF